MRKYVGFLIAFLIVFSIVSGCSNSSNPNNAQSTPGNKPEATGGDQAANQNSKSKDISGTVNLVVAGWALEDSIDPITGKNSKGFNKYLDETFKKQYPNIKLVVTSVPWENAQAKMTSMLISGQADVLYIAGGWANTFYQQGLLMGLDDLMAKDKSFDRKIYIQSLLDTSQSIKSPDGKTTMGLPMVMGQRMPIYDKKIFEDWGVEPLSNKPTPEEILEKAQKMTGKNPKTGEQNYGLWWDGQDLNLGPVVGLKYAYNAPTAEGDASDFKHIKWEINSPGNVKVLQWLEKAAMLPPAAFLNRQGAENFGTEKNNIAIKLASNGSAIMSQYKVTKNKALLDRFVPTLDVGPNGENDVKVDPIVIAKKTQNVAASWEVAKFIAGYETQKYFYENTGATPALANPDFIDPDDKFTKASLEIAKVSKALGIGGTPFGYSDYIPGIINFVSQVRNGQKVDIQKYLDDLQARAEKWSASQ